MLILIITTITIIVIIIIKVKLAQLVRKNTQNKGKIKDFSYLIYRTVKGFTFSSGVNMGKHRPHGKQCAIILLLLTLFLSFI